MHVKHKNDIVGALYVTYNATFMLTHNGTSVVC